MMDYERLRSLAEGLYVPAAVRIFPEGGDAAIRRVLSTCTRIFSVIDPVELGGPIVVFSQAESHSSLDTSSTRNVLNVSELRTHIDSGFALVADALTHAMSVWPGSPPVDIEVLRRSGVVFWHSAGEEKFLIAEEEFPLERIFGASRQSFFSRPSYANLEDALAYYRAPVVRRSDCPILETIWYDCNRLFLKAQPEDRIQESLLNFLRIALRSDAEVMREQNVDLSHPVDIRVRFHYTNRVALIEVKWLGKSKTPEGDLATQYYQGRAIEGASQLAGYLDSFRHSSPFSAVQGYLVILDARRRGLSADTTNVSTEEGMHYEDREISFSPQYHIDRNDFSEPVRMFAEPRFQ